MTITDETTEARAILERVGWTQRGLAELMHVHETRIRRMFSGRHAMDPAFLTWLRGLGEYHRLNPPPKLPPL